MDENKKETGLEESGKTSELRTEEEGATTVLCAEDCDNEETEGATTVLTGPDPVLDATSKKENEKPQFEDRTVLVSPQPGMPMPNAPMGAPMQNGSMGMPMPNAPMGAPMQNGSMGMPMPNAPMGTPMQNGSMGMPMPNAPMGTPMQNGSMGMPMQNAPMGMPMPNAPMGAPMQNGSMGMPNNGQMPINGQKPPKQKKEKPQKAPKQPKQPKVKKNAASKKKKTGWIVAICIVAVLGIAAGTYFLFFTPEKRYARSMETAQSAMDAASYEEASDAYEEALAIFKDRIPAMVGLVDAEIKLGESEDAREDFVEFRASICEMETEVITENIADVVRFYAFADALYSDADSLIDAYKEGYDLTSDNQIKAALVEVYIDKADAMEDSEYEDKLAVYEEALALDTSNADALEGRKTCAYAVLDGMMEEAQYDGAEAFINTYAEQMTEVDFSYYTEKIESERALMNAQHDLMEQVISLMSASDYAGMLSVDGSENASLVVENMEGDCYIYAPDGFDSSYTGKAAGIYRYSEMFSEGYYFYYGDYENGVRSGQGTSYIKNNGYDEAYTIYEGAWSNDKPNGAGTQTAVNEDAGDELVTVQESGTLKDGLFDGEVTVSLISTDEEYAGTYTGTYIAANGDAPDIRAEYPDYDFSDVSEDKAVYVVLTCEDSPLFWNFSKGSGAKLGVFGFDF